MPHGGTLATTKTGKSGEFVRFRVAFRTLSGIRTHSEERAILFSEKSARTAERGKRAKVRGRIEPRDSGEAKVSGTSEGTTAAAESSV
jgi:hypothetical protein